MKEPGQIAEQTNIITQIPEPYTLKQNIPVHVQYFSDDSRTAKESAGLGIFLRGQGANTQEALSDLASILTEQFERYNEQPDRLIGAAARSYAKMQEYIGK